MNSQMKKCVRVVLGPFVRNRYTRMVLAYPLYRRWIAHSEATVLLHQKEEQLDESYWIGRLRQYAHMVDKGLHRGDFTKGRGMQAYGAAKAALAHINSPLALDDPSVQWATRKIRKYEEFQSGKSPGLQCEPARTTCKYEDLLDAIRTRRSVRHYLDKPVEEDVIERITDVLDWSPNSCNRQTARVYASNNPDIVRQCVKLHGGAACFTDIMAPLFLTFCADSRVYEMPVEVALPHVDVALGIENCVLVAHTLGISLTLLTWAQHVEWQDRELRRIFGIPAHFQIIVSAVGGYADGGAEIPVRKKKELFLVR